MVYKLNNDAMKIIEEVKKITCINYEKNNEINVDSLFEIIKDLLHEYHNLEEKLEEFAE